MIPPDRREPKYVEISSVVLRGIIEAALNRELSERHTLTLIMPLPPASLSGVEHGQRWLLRFDYDFLKDMDKEQS